MLKAMEDAVLKYTLAVKQAGVCEPYQTQQPRIIKSQPERDGIVLYARGALPTPLAA